MTLFFKKNKKTDVISSKTDPSYLKRRIFFLGGYTVFQKNKIFGKKPQSGAIATKQDTLSEKMSVSSVAYSRFLLYNIFIFTYKENL